MGAYAGMEERLVPKCGGAGSEAGTVTSAAIDTAGFSEAVVLLSVGNVTATGTLAVKVQDCATSGGIYADVSGAAFSTKIDGVDNTAFVGRLKLDGNTVKRFIKVVSTVANDDVEYGIVVLLAGNQYNPQTVATAEFTI